jgi:dihydroxy-acid dehydratase
VTEQITDGDALANAGLGGFARRAFLRAQGRGAVLTRRRPVIGICSSWSELNPCNGSLRTLADDVKRGVAVAGGQAYEFPTISLNEQFVFPTTMILRNLMAMDVEEMIRRSPIDAVVLLAGCDKTVPAQLMGAASAGRPAIMLTAGPRITSRFRGVPLVTDDFWELAVARGAGEISDAEWQHLEGALCASVGVCNVLGTATTMAMMAEALGIAPPGSALLPAPDARRSAIAEEVGRLSVELARSGPTPAEVLTEKAFQNASRVLLATGGSTNAVIHLEALAGRVGLRLGLDQFAELGRTTPVVAAVRPNGPWLLEDFESAGGVPAVLRRLGRLINGDAPTVIGATIGEIAAACDDVLHNCMSTLESPFQAAGGIGVVRGNLAPRGAVIKRSAARRDLWQHTGPAVVYESAADAVNRAFSPDLTCSDDGVLVVRGAGPVGGPGMPELGQIPIPVSARRRGITEMVCVTDARVSGTQKGATVLHASPESTLGGALSVVADGDPIELDAIEGRIELLVEPDEIERRLARRVAVRTVPPRGYGRLYAEHVLQADEGCDFDFLRDERIRS